MNDKSNSRLISWQRFWKWDKSFEPWIKTHMSWFKPLCWSIIGVSALMIAMPNHVEKVLRKIFHIITSVVLIAAILAMTTPQVAYSAQVSYTEQVPAESQEKMAPAVYFFDTSTNRISLIEVGLDPVAMEALRNGNWQTNEMGLCGALILGGAAAASGGYAAYRLYKCAKRLLYPTNSPPTNPPPNQPTNPPSSSSSSRANAYGDAITAAGNTFGIRLPLMYPEGATFTLTNLEESTAVADVSSAGWTDWQGNPVTLEFSIVIWPTNRVSQAGFLYEPSSTNLIDWVTESISITGWVSSASSSCANCDTNVITVSYDQYGNPFYTNWYSLQRVTNSAVDFKSLPLGFLPGIPKRSDPQLFFRGVIK